MTNANRYALGYVIDGDISKRFNRLIVDNNFIHGKNLLMYNFVVNQIMRRLYLPTRLRYSIVNVQQKTNVLQCYELLFHSCYYSIFIVLGYLSTDQNHPHPAHRFDRIYKYMSKEGEQFRSVAVLRRAVLNHYSEVV
nr:MAG TPA: hypothetical protein [Caudoviricetes sp.]